MTTFVEDSPRAFQARWIVEAAASGSTRAAVLNPWASPWHHRGGPGKKPGLRERASELAADKVTVWFDATTHALQMGGVGDFRYYDEFDLWGGPRGDLSTNAARVAHVRKVFAVQDAIGSPHLGPTVLLHTGLSQTSLIALEMAKIAVDLDPTCFLTIAGSSPFWASGSALDAHVGALASLEPQGWFTVVSRPISAIPATASSDEVFGLCRSVRSLSEDAWVHVSHGDLAGLPAIAAGASTVGTGWDKRQRVQAFTDFAARGPAGGFGSWYERVTLQALLGSLSVREASVLGTQNQALAQRLGDIPAPGPKEAFFHHLQALSGLVTMIAAAPDYRSRFDSLMGLYGDASREWPAVQTLTGSDTAAADWIAPLQAGLAAYGAAEGW